MSEPGSQSHPPGRCGVDPPAPLETWAWFRLKFCLISAGKNNKGVVGVGFQIGGGNLTILDYDRS